MNDEMIRVEGVSCRFDGLEALRAISLTVRRDEFIAVVGPSGCGKTTLLNVLSGFLRPDSGDVKLAGKGRTIHQQDGLFPWLTVEENIELGLRGERDAARRAARRAEWLSLIGLSAFARHYPHQLSGGMRQLVELARALAGDTDILLMDEPFSALDYLVRLRMRRELARLLSERRRTVLLVTHDIGEAAQLADRIIVLTERPGTVRCEIAVDHPRPRSPTASEVVEVTRRVMAAMGLERANCTDVAANSAAGTNCD